jgi:hypothetical protein
MELHYVLSIYVLLFSFHFQLLWIRPCNVLLFRVTFERVNRLDPC